MARKHYCDFCNKDLSSAHEVYPRRIELRGLAGTLYTTSGMQLRGEPFPEYSLTIDSCYDCMQLVLGCMHGLQHRTANP